MFLQQNAPRDARLLELPGPPYQYYGRFSANTGIPTVLGWIQHEAFWRDNTYKLPNERADQVKAVYNSRAFTPEIEPSRTGGREQDVKVTSQRCLDRCAEVIRKNPEHWLWTYKRWKRRPSPEVGRYPFYSKFDPNT